MPNAMAVRASDPTLSDDGGRGGNSPFVLKFRHSPLIWGAAGPPKREGPCKHRVLPPRGVVDDAGSEPVLAGHQCEAGDRQRDLPICRKFARRGLISGLG